ncbi:MAG TPA: hypothetical protein VIF12_03450 [Micavibrio sp.]
MHTLPLPAFIRKNLEVITEEWRAFAETLASPEISDLELRDHIHQILFFIADNIEIAETSAQQYAKSRGHDDKGESPAMIHATLRHKTGFDLVEMVSEYRALRATIIRLWTKEKLVLVDSDVLSLIRFNEAIDQLLAQSIACFMKNYPIKTENT